jgi:hypothetical protein
LAMAKRRGYARKTLRKEGAKMIKRYIRWFCFFLIFFSVSAVTLAVDFTGYLDNSLLINNEDDFTGTHKFKLDIKSKTESYFMMVSADAMTNYGSNTDTSFTINRAYLDLYPAWGAVTLGKQRIAWGGSYYFNLSDLFNPVNVLDPKGEKDGIHGLDVKWNITDTMQTEGVILPAAKFSESDYGVKLKLTVGLFDITAGSIKKANVSPAVAKRNANVIECKGEFSENTPGIWVQYAFYTDESGGVTTDYESSVYGLDYTFNIGNGLYVLGEYTHDGRVDNYEIYSMIRYNLQSYLTLNFTGFRKEQTNASFYSLGLKHQLNDAIEIEGAYIVYPGGSALVKNSLPNIDTEFVLKIKTNF